MGRESGTKTLLRLAGRGQEIVADPDGSRTALVPVIHRPRNTSDPRPWLHAEEDSQERRFTGAQCFARLALPLPSGTVLEHTQNRRRGHFAGPGELLPDTFVKVWFTGSPDPMEISRTLLRKVGA